MRILYLIAGAVCFWCSLAAPASASDGPDVSIESLFESPSYLESPLDSKLAQIDAWLAGRDGTRRDAQWAIAVAERITVIGRQGEYGVAGTYADTVMDDMLAALEGSDAYIKAAYGVGFVKIYSEKVDEALVLVDHMRSHSSFGSDPMHRQYTDTLMVAIHTQTGNPILAAGILIDKYNSGDIEKLPPSEQLKLISNITFALIKGRAYDEAQTYIDIARTKLDTWMSRGELNPLNIRRVRWHLNSNSAEMLVKLERFGELAELYPLVKEDADHIGGAIYTTQAVFVEAAVAYSEGKYANAARLIDQAIEETKVLGAVDNLILYYDLQAKIYKAAGRPEEALRSYLDGKALDDALKAEQGRARVEYMNTRRALLERNAQIRDLEAKTSAAEQMRRRDQIIAGVSTAALAMVLFFTLALVRSRRRLRTYADVLEKSEQKAQTAAQAKASFLANMSHEIRTPLNGLLGMTQVLAEHRYGGEHDECVDIILRSGESLLTIVNDVLDLSKIEAGKMTVTPTPTKIKDLVEDVAGLWSANAKEKGIDLRIRYNGGLPEAALFDGARVRQCTSNLISNAIKFTEHGHVTLEISTQNDARVLVIAVEDTGLGIKDEVAAKLFSAFEQGDTSSTRKFGGTGLGLSIVSSFAQLMGGDVTVSSVYGQGSRFVLSIPIKPLENSPAKLDVIGRSSDNNLPAALSSIKTILLVDDNQVNRLVVRAFLKDSGIKIIEAENGRQAVDHLEATGEADLILLDMHMPEMDGPACIRHIRAADAAWSDVPILVLTADAMEGDRERYMELAVQGYLAKPVVQKDLWSEIHRIDGTTDDSQINNSAQRTIA
ncbi:MAG: ATP-binding protein [Pseudomonadota bacterium]